MTTLDEIQARADAATEGPWEVRHDHFEAGPGPDDEAQDWYLVEGTDAVEHWAHYDKATTTFIAHAREDVPALVSALRAVEALHQSDGHKQLIGPYCTGCTSPIDGGPELYPCPTIRAVQQALDG